jgi:hypothetical protein
MDAQSCVSIQLIIKQTYNMFKRKYIDFVIDFDGTCVEHEYPRI